MLFYEEGNWRARPPLSVRDLVMNVILLERIEKLGQMGDEVRVKPGYARNYLLPQKKALRATDANRKQFETQKAVLEAENLKQRDEAERVAKSLDGLGVIMVRQASDAGVLYGSVTTRDIASAVTEAGVRLDRQQVVLDRAIKELGVHELLVRLHPEVSVAVKVAIAKSSEEGAALLKAQTETDSDASDSLDAVLAETSALIAETGEAAAAPAEAAEETPSA